LSLYLHHFAKSLTRLQCSGTGPVAVRHACVKPLGLQRSSNAQQASIVSSLKIAGHCLNTRLVVSAMAPRS